MSAPNYHCTSQQRVLKTLMCMFGHEIDGLAPSQIAKAADSTASQVTRDLWNLKEAGLIEYLPGGDRVRISPQLGRKAVAMYATFKRAENQLTELANRYALNTSTN